MMTPEEYEAKRNARYERMVAASLRAEKESAANWTQAHMMADCIPFGQPILVGHHSETRDRNFRSRIESKHRKGYELHQKAEEYASRAASIASNDTIYSDNPQAVELLTDKATELKAEQAEMKRINAALRKGADFDTLEMSDAMRQELLVIDRVQGYYQPKTKGFPPYMMTSINTRIKTAEKRAAVVEKKQTTEDKDVTIKGVKIEYRPSENRIRATFEGRVSKEVYTQLRQGGYRVAPSFGDYTFSAYYNYNAGETLRRIIEAIPA